MRNNIDYGYRLSNGANTCSFSNRRVGVVGGALYIAALCFQVTQALVIQATLLAPLARITSLSATGPSKHRHRSTI